MKPHIFGARPIHSLLRDHPTLCGHIEAGLVCGREREHSDHEAEVDVDAALDRRMRGAPHG